MQRPSTANIKAALREAKAKLEQIPIDSGTGFICWQLPNNRTGDYLKDWIAEQLHPHSTLTGWYQSKNLHYVFTNENKRANRLAWIDYMLDQPD